jgi:AAA15 family ATPase/GTPase
LVTESAGFKPDESIGPYEPHVLERNYKTKPVTLEMTFVSNDIQYDYLISYTSNKIEQEELYYYPGTARTLLYTRAVDKEMKFGDYYKGAKKVVEKLLLPNQLFLSKAVENNVDALKDAYRFFSRTIIPYSIMDDYYENSLASFYAKKLAEDKDSPFSRQFNALICAVDTGIAAVTAEEVDWNNYKFPGNMPEDIKKQFQEKYKYDIKTKHHLFDGDQQVGFEQFEIGQESTGTQSLLAMGGVILEALLNGNVLVVDEFEKNLHPLITQFLIQIFHNPATNRNKAQLIFATHDVTQLANDRFRRDQVFFTEKNEHGATKLFRCSDIEGVRLGTPLDKWYVTGRFGATPIINDIDLILEMQKDGEAQN